MMLVCWICSRYIFGDDKVYKIDMFLDTVDIDTSFSAMSTYAVENDDIGVEDNLGVIML